MSKTLEFVEKEIEREQSMIKTYQEFFKTDKTEFDKQITNGYIQIHQKNIILLQQIKCELEAWEVVKPAIKSKLRVIGKYRDKIIEVNHREYNEGTTEYQALKKALEVEDANM